MSFQHFLGFIYLVFHFFCSTGTQSEVAPGVKRQAGSESQHNDVYALVNVNRGGILVDIMRKAMMSGNRDGVSLNWSTF